MIKKQSARSDSSFIVAGPGFTPGARPAWCLPKRRYNVLHVPKRRNRGYNVSGVWLANRFLQIGTAGKYKTIYCPRWPVHLWWKADRFQYKLTMEQDNTDIRLYQSVCMNCVYYSGKSGYSPEAVMHQVKGLMRKL